MALSASGKLSVQSEAVLREQYASLARQVPLMYALMFLNVLFLALVTADGDGWAASFMAPLALTAIIAVRAAAWYIRRGVVATDDHIRRYLQGTVFRAGAFSLLFGGWGLYLFLAADPFHTTAIALFIFVGSISCCYCLQALPAAARLVLLFGAMPVTTGLLASGDWYFTAMGLTFLLGAGVILRTIATTRSAVFESLQSRSEMSVLIEALRRSEEHYRFSVELNPQIPWISDPEGQIVEVGPRWSELTGTPAGDALGTGWTNSLHPDDLPVVLAHWNEALTSVDNAVADVRYRVRNADGSYRWCRARANPRRDADDRIVSWYGTLEDIHDQITAELALRESEERYRLASHATNDVIWDWSHRSDRIEWGNGAVEVLGYPELSIGTAIAWWKERVHADDLPAVNKTFERILRNLQDSWNHEYRFRVAQGHFINLHSRGYVVRDDAGQALRSIGALLDVTAARRAEDELRWAANHDPLTDLPNRKLFGEVLEQALHAASADASCVCVIVIDVDGFKLLNDSMGHAAGDELLRTIARRLQMNLPVEATVARLGGDEFAVIVPGLDSGSARAPAVNAILKGVADTLTIDESVLPVSISAGAAMWPADGDDAEEILKSADLALYAAKAEGAGVVREFRSEMRASAESRKSMLRDAREALRDDRIIPFYQAKVDLRSGKVVGFEALLRWSHHRRGLQPPDSIRSAFDDSLLGSELTDRMIDRVLADVVEFTERGVAFGRIAINGSLADFRRDDFADRILGKFQRAGVPPTLLELEVTESVFVDHLALNVERALRNLVAEGVSIALDDFGTGYASLTHLQQFPVHVLKIDRSFISRLDSADSADFAIVHGVIDIAHRMNIVTVAEGVENDNQLAQLRSLGCDIAQGYLFSRAISAERVPGWLRNWARDRPAAPERAADRPAAHPPTRSA
ncbi:MAG: EAL domain-containing protein [Sphingopyxis sp.]|nr:EAL domain-containing protein [Sphingopyxis sp.]